ncbi:peptidase domain-containing ABC transporter [Pedobacter psychrotolerans]|uniref:peptidase domain-containing ABC transporter n=1 Tax=Pedobacter psychrotolerans TaxID=1843235 RepID=UPI003F949F46
MQRYNKNIKQHDTTDCGAACLASVVAHYGLKVPVARIRQLASTDDSGTNIFGMVEAAAALGFKAKGVRTNLENLGNIPLPAVACIKKPNGDNHFIVLDKVGHSSVTIMDPADGKSHRYSDEKFGTQWNGILILFSVSEKFVPGTFTRSVFSRFWTLISAQKVMLFQASLCALIYTVLALSSFLFIKRITDSIIIAGDYGSLNLVVMGMLVVLVFQVIIGALKGVLLLKTGKNIDSSLILGYYKHLMGLPQKFFDAMRVGEIISRINDAVKIRSFINEVSVNLMVSLFIVVLSLIFLVFYHWKLGLTLFLLLPLYLIIYLITDRVNSGSQRRIMENSAQLESQLVESLTSVSTLKRFNLQYFSNDQIQERIHVLLKSVFVSGINSIISGISTEFISRLITILLLWIGSKAVFQGEVTPGTLLSSYILIGYFTGPLTALVSANRSIQDAIIASDRLFEIMDLETEDKGGNVIFSKSNMGDIRFNKVSFRYGSNRNVLNELNFTIDKGSLTAIVGESGCGKSTLTSLLQHLYTPTSGEILIGDHLISDFEVSTLRRLIAIVPQEVDIFSGNVIDNIALGEQNPDMQHIISICLNLGILSFIENLQDGFYTRIGKNGIILSAGQKQRLAIARALYFDPEILVLDEATSALDSISEQFVQQIITNLRSKGRTVIVIAHRLTTIQHADRIIVLKNGIIQEDGCHSALMSYKGTYYDLWTQQFGNLVH